MRPGAVWDPKPHLHLAQLYASKGQHEQAVKEQALFERLSLVQNRVELYEKKVADYPKNARAHYLLGLTYVEQGRLALGLQFFERALALDPSYAPAFHGKGRVLYQRNQIAQAIRAYERACQLDTQLYDAFNDLGQAYHQSGRYDRAVTAYRRSLEIKPDLALVHSNLGLARLKGSTRRVSGWQGNARAKTTLGGTAFHNASAVARAFGWWASVGVCSGAVRRGSPISNYSFRSSSVASGIFSIPTRLATSNRSSRYLCGVS